MNPTLEPDWAFCEQALVDVSRTFSQPIQLLPEPLRVALTCGYLLCRVVDTVEDHPFLDGRTRDDLFSLFIDVLDGERPGEEFSRAFEDGGELNAELVLARSLPRVLRVFRAQKPEVRIATVRWLAEMANGMRLYCRRDRDGALSALNTAADLERYCYFVAGTVGHLITDLFCDYMGASGAVLEPALRGHCESFGVGLQLVNILKDITDDFERKRCYVPRQLCRAQGFEPEQLLSPVNRQSAQRALLPTLESAVRHLEQALEYTLLLPPQQAELRLFCLLPLWMALETLALLAGNDGMFVPGQQVKISRDAVARVVREGVRLAADDASLRLHTAGLVGRVRDRLAPSSEPSRLPLQPGHYVQV
ncbi:MAG TPA: squalene/phytoene synthase family protein [Polyangiaceae bacterium]|nr:squalene/phytoene synthase family protein [Polyangiaceae bacterium]